MALLNMPIELIPTWIVDRKREGSLWSEIAAFAPGRCSLASFWSRDFREETIASSDIAKKPFIKIRTMMSPMSIELIANYCFLSDFGVKRKGLILFSHYWTPSIWCVNSTRRLDLKKRLHKIPAISRFCTLNYLFHASMSCYTAKCSCTINRSTYNRQDV